MMDSISYNFIFKTENMWEMWGFTPDSTHNEIYLQIKFTNI